MSIRLSMNLKKIAEIICVAALYAVLTWIAAPISYQVFQFRISEALKSIVVSRRHLIWAFVIGNALSNLFSPFVGPWELVWMPFVNLLGASLAWVIGSRFKGLRAFIFGGVIYAIIVSAGLSVMLSTLFNINAELVFLYVLAPEMVLMVGFSPAMKRASEKLSAITGY
jgi:uncharacterized membrane protein